MSDALRDALEALEPFAKLLLNNSRWATVPDGTTLLVGPGGGITVGNIRRAAKAYEALRANSSDVSVPRDFVLVPKEPTEEMIEAAELAYRKHHAEWLETGSGTVRGLMYRMLKAALSASPQDG